MSKTPKLAYLAVWWDSTDRLIMACTVLVGINAGCWAFGYISNLQPTFSYVPFARGFGKALDFNCNAIFFPVLYNILSWLRTTPVVDVLPLQNHIELHKFLGLLITLTSIGHIYSHSMNYVTNLGLQAMVSVAGITGFLITLFMLLMAISALLRTYTTKIFGSLRYDGFLIFQAFHKLWIVVIPLLWIHSPNFWPFSIFPVCLILLERLIQQRRANLEVEVIDAEIVGNDILYLKMKLALSLRKSFKYSPGQYLLMNCPAINKSEWHAFSISSSPNEEFFSCHIRCKKHMDWTYRLRALFDLCERSQVDEGSNFPQIRIDGPYGGALTQEIEKFGCVAFVAAGIGITPFLSIIKDINYKGQLQQLQQMSEVMSPTGSMSTSVQGLRTLRGRQDSASQLPVALSPLSPTATPRSPIFAKARKERLQLDMGTKHNVAKTGLDDKSNSFLLQAQNVTGVSQDLAPVKPIYRSNSIPTLNFKDNANASLSRAKLGNPTGSLRRPKNEKLVISTLIGGVGDIATPSTLERSNAASRKLVRAKSERSMRGNLSKLQTDLPPMPGLGRSNSVSKLSNKSFSLVSVEKTPIYVFYIYESENDLKAFMDEFDRIYNNSNTASRIRIRVFSKNAKTMNSEQFPSFQKVKGRPNWNMLISNMFEEHKGENIGYFVCGARLLATHVLAACNENAVNKEAFLTSTDQNAPSMIKKAKTTFNFFRWM